MRGPDIIQESLFTTVHLEKFVSPDHQLRKIKPIIDEALKRISWLFDQIYSEFGKPSIPPERLIRAQLLQVLYSIRSERQLVEQIHYNLLYRWFIGLTIDDEVWDHSTFSANRDRLIENEVVHQLFEEVIDIARKKGLLSDDHFSVDGTLIQAWASQKSYRPKDDDSDNNGNGGRNTEADFHGQKRSNDTHESKTDKQARLFKKGKGKEARLCYMGHTVMENRHGLIVKAEASLATGKAEREVALKLLAELPGNHRKTAGADKNYDTKEFVSSCRELNITPHVAQNNNRRGGSAIDGRTSSTPGYKISQRKRKQVEEPFGWGKLVGAIRQVKKRGLANIDMTHKITMMGWNLMRMCRLQDQYA